MTGEVLLVPRLDQSSSNSINEINAGHALYAHLESIFGKMEKRANRSKSMTIIRVGMWLVAIGIALVAALCIYTHLRH